MKQRKRRRKGRRNNELFLPLIASVNGPAGTTDYCLFVEVKVDGGRMMMVTSHIQLQGNVYDALECGWRIG